MSNCNHDCSSCSQKCSEQDLRAKLNQYSTIRKVVAVSSGKGGVGKSSVTAMLAVMMARRGYKVGVLDAYNALAEFPITAPREEEIRYAFGLCYLATIMDCEKYYRYTPDLPNWQNCTEFPNLLYSLGFSILE